MKPHMKLDRWLGKGLSLSRDRKLAKEYHATPPREEVGGGDIYLRGPSYDMAIALWERRVPFPH